MKCTRKMLVAILAINFTGSTVAIATLLAQDPHPQEQAPSLGSPGAQRKTQPTVQDAPPQDSRGSIRTTVSLVVVPVTVKDSAGELVTDLQQNDFRVFEDGIEQPIAQFSAEAFPLSAAVLVDDDLKQGTAEKVQKTLETLAAGFGPSDEVSLWRFDQVPEQISEDFIADNDALLTQLKKIDLSSSFAGIGSYTMTNGPRVNTAQPPGPAKIPAEANGHPNTKHINDAIYAAAEQLQDRPRDRRKIIFLISDGQNAKNNTHNYDETLKLLLSADVSVYAVGVGEANLNRGITFLGNNILAKYAHATGGDIFYGGVSRENLEGLYARVAEQARNQYTIAYSGSHTDKSKPYHSIEVRVKRPGLSLLTRDGYYLSTTP
ncbi:MAG TPA: VWA domain-containing protein [Candidatus Acidoferrales bacterium]|nr:VWA domain-containing protein [Candidatus Acidoferrales bacterium]